MVTFMASKWTRLENTMNRRKKKTLDREEEILKILEEFENVDDHNLEKIADFAFRLGSVDKYEFPLFDLETDV